MTCLCESGVKLIYPSIHPSIHPWLKTLAKQKYYASNFSTTPTYSMTNLCNLHFKQFSEPFLESFVYFLFLETFYFFQFTELELSTKSLKPWIYLDLHYLKFMAHGLQEILQN